MKAARLVKVWAGAVKKKGRRRKDEALIIILKRVTRFVSARAVLRRGVITLGQDVIRSHFR